MRMANTYWQVQKADVPVAMLVSTGPRIDYCFMSRPLQDFDALEWPRKGHPLSAGAQTAQFNANPDNWALHDRQAGTPTRAR